MNHLTEINGGTHLTSGYALCNFSLFLAESLQVLPLAALLCGSLMSLVFLEEEELWETAGFLGRNTLWCANLLTSDILASEKKQSSGYDSQRTSSWVGL